MFGAYFTPQSSLSVGGLRAQRPVSAANKSPAGEDFMTRGQATTGQVGATETLLFPSRDLINSAQRYFDHALAASI